MGYLDESGLAHYDGLIKSWTTYDSGTVTGLAPLLNWQKTADAASVTCYPVPVSPLEPVVSFMFTETPPLDGNPKSPTNPSTITGVSTITVTRCETVGVDSTDYTIDLNGTFYGGSVDLSAGTMTVTWVGYTLTGTENWYFESDLGTSYVRYASNNYYAVPIQNVLTGDTIGVCSHFDYNAIYSAQTEKIYVRTNGRFLVTLLKSAFPEPSDWKTWIASQYSNNTPMILVYRINVPYTVQLTPTQIYSLSQLDPYTPRINTVYSDQVSVQVGYPKSPQATAAELTNAIISLGGNV